MSEFHFLKSDDDDEICFLDENERVLLVTHDAAENHVIDVEKDVIVCDGKIFYHAQNTPAGVFLSDRSFDWYEAYVSRAYVYGIDALYPQNVMLSGRSVSLWDYHVCVMPESDTADLFFCATKEEIPEAVRYSTDACESAIQCKPVYAGCIVQVERIPADSENPVQKRIHAALSAIVPSPLMRDNCDDDE